MTVRPSTIQQISLGFIGHKVGLARELHCASCHQPQERKTMGTELVTVTVTVFFYGLCALFVRICDRI